MIPTVVENSLSRTLFNELQNCVLDDFKFAWYYAPLTAIPAEFGEENPLGYSFAHNAVLDGKDNSEYAEIARTCINEALKNTSYKLKKLYRARFGLITSVGENITHDPHIDFHFPHKTGLLYLTNTEGNTFIYDEKYDWQSSLSHMEYRNKYYTENLKVLHESVPLENKLIVFPGEHYHSSSSTKNTLRRIVLNFNFA